MACTSIATPSNSHEKTIRRIDGLVNKLTLSVGAVKTRYCLLHLRHEEEQVTLCVRERNNASDNIFEGDEAGKEEGIKAMLSYNACIMVVQYFSGLVAFLVEENELPIAVSEAHMHGVVPERAVRMRRGNRNLANIAGKHTMLKFTSTDASLNALLGSGGVYSDATSWQYWREQGLRKVSSYPVDRDSLDSIHDTDNALGTEYHELLKQFAEGRSHIMIKPEQVYIESTEARIQAINNALYNTIMKLGGAKFISLAEDAAWETAEQQMVDAATGAMWQLEQGHDSGLDTKADSHGYNGHGHWVFATAIDRASDLGLADLLALRSE